MFAEGARQKLGQPGELPLNSVEVGGLDAARRGARTPRGGGGPVTSGTAAASITRARGAIKEAISASPNSLSKFHTLR